MKPRVICLANQKGGVGKTTSAIHLAAGLARAGRTALLIDLDAQGNASSIFLESGVEPDESVYAVFKDRRPVAALKRKTRIPGLELLPASLNLAEVETLLAGAVDGFFRLKDSLAAEDSGAEFVIIDCPPNLGQLTVNAFVAADELAVPLQTAKFSLDGLKTILETSHTVQKRFNERLHVAGALVTMYNPRTAISAAILDPIEEYIRLFSARISRSVVIEEAHLMNQTTYEYDPRSKPAQEYTAFTAEILDGVQKG